MHSPIADTVENLLYPSLNHYRLKIALQTITGCRSLDLQHSGQAKSMIRMWSRICENVDFTETSFIFVGFSEDFGHATLAGRELV